MFLLKVFSTYLVSRSCKFSRLWKIFSFSLCKCFNLLATISMFVLSSLLYNWIVLRFSTSLSVLLFNLATLSWLFLKSSNRTSIFFDTVAFFRISEMFEEFENWKKKIQNSIKIDFHLFYHFFWVKLIL